ncbi:ArsR/SmtB family transcription factor [Microbacterium sp. B2969]|uniref:ArsR/SmtB family transcription factor n=1 Tax=Microbacterium alkaliflavum TaxID=3248839 RepID=A0ABW7Q456_9MICO
MPSNLKGASVGVASSSTAARSATDSTDRTNQSQAGGQQSYGHGMHPFEAMAEPARRRIVEILASGEHTAGQLADAVGHEFRISRTAVSKHLRVLRDAGFADVRAEENFRWWRLTPDAIRQLHAEVRELRRKWKMRSGWDADARQLRDPFDFVSGYASVPRKGSGKPYRRGTRGTQTEPPVAADPETGAYPRHRLDR